MFFAYLPNSLCPFPKGTARISEETVGTTITRKMTDPFPDTTRMESPSLRESFLALSGCISAQGFQYTRGISPEISCNSGWLAPSPVMSIRVVKGVRRKESGASVLRIGASNRACRGVSPFCASRPRLKRALSLRSASNRAAGGEGERSLLSLIPTRLRVFAGTPPAAFLLEQTPEIRKRGVAVHLPAAFPQLFEEIQGNGLEIGGSFPCSEDRFDNHS